MENKQVIKTQIGEMPVFVESFIMNDTSELIYDNEKLDRWHELIKELALEGQNKVVDGEKSPIPFHYLKSTEYAILRQICPVISKVHEFNVMPIPVEILELIALAQNEKHFQKIEIWYDDKSPDPVAVGITHSYYVPSWQSGVPGHLMSREFDTKKQAFAAGAKSEWLTDWNEKHYLIGRWGTESKSWDELREMATQRFIRSETARLNKKIKEYQRDLSSLNEDAIQKFG